MITEKDLQEAIAECQGQRNPTANTCIKLAAFLTIQRELYGREEYSHNAAQKMPVSYSYAASPSERVENTISYQSDSEFSKAISGKNLQDILPVMDELMLTLQQLNPRLYNGVMRRLND